MAELAAETAPLVKVAAIHHFLLVPSPVSDSFRGEPPGSRTQNRLIKSPKETRLWGVVVSTAYLKLMTLVAVRLWRRVVCAPLGCQRGCQMHNAVRHPASRDDHAVERCSLALRRRTGR